MSHETGRLMMYREPREGLKFLSDPANNTDQEILPGRWSGLYPDKEKSSLTPIRTKQFVTDSVCTPRPLAIYIRWGRGTKSGHWLDHRSSDRIA